MFTLLVTSTFLIHCFCYKGNKHNQSVCWDKRGNDHLFTLINSHFNDYRLRALLPDKIEVNELVDLTVIKQNNSSPFPHAALTSTGTQTEDQSSVCVPVVDTKASKEPVQVKEEPRCETPDFMKLEDADHIDDYSTLHDDVHSENSDDNMSLLSLKKKKKLKCNEQNGEVIEKKGRKKKGKLKDWGMLGSALPEGAALVVDRQTDVPKLDVVKEEEDSEMLVALDVKKEPGDMELFQCCICFTQCYSRSDMLQHYR